MRVQLTRLAVRAITRTKLRDPIDKAGEHWRASTDAAFAENNVDPDRGQLLIQFQTQNAWSAAFVAAYTPRVVYRSEVLHSPNRR